MKLCDFCSSTKPVWIFPCETFVIADVKARSLSDWTACEDCAALIVAEKWRELARACCEKTVNGRMMVGVIGKEGAIAQVMKMHGEFRKHRSGEPRRVA